MHPRRITTVNNHRIDTGNVVYWMSRDQRAFDNWALHFAYSLALKRKSRFSVIFNISNDYSFASVRHWDFMLKGLKELWFTLAKKNIPLFILYGNAFETIPSFIKSNSITDLVYDFDPMIIKRIWVENLKKVAECNIFEVDAHNVLPCRFVSDKQEYSAFTIRKKINKLIHEYLDEFPELEIYPYNSKEFVSPKENFDKIDYSLFAQNPLPVNHFNPGEAAAHEVLSDFIRNKLELYNTRRNEPSADFQSGLSPYLHYGQISSQRVALEIKKSIASEEAKAAFLEELIVRKELSDNFCLYNKNYMTYEGFPDWAKKSLDKHRFDKRDYLYDLSVFENAETHDILWNCAQRQMVVDGKMHGYMRMYWAKKILEWTSSPEEAMHIAVYLNDKYSLDGRDPNGYAGIAWSIGGVHDRPWQERPVFGMVRYMSGERLMKKHDMAEYLRQYSA